MGYFYYDYTFLLLIPGMILMGYAQWRVQSTYKKNQRKHTRRGETGAQVARQMLNQAGLSRIPIETVQGKLSDHYDPKAQVLRLSREVAEKDTIAAVGIAAHEVGHAIQHEQSYAPLAVRNAIVPVVNIASHLSIPLLLAGFFLEMGGLVTAALIMYASVVVFQLITLPVEYNASSRAKALLAADGSYSQEEQAGVRQVLSAAAMTYLAATFVALLQLIRLLLITRNRD